LPSDARCQSKFSATKLKSFMLSGSGMTGWRRLHEWVKAGVWRRGHHHVALIKR
jgi:hypothetical protein